PAGSVNRSNTLTCLPPGPKQPAAAVLLMYGLLADAQPLSDRLPRPALSPGVVNLHRLQDLDQAPQRGYRRQSDRGVLAASCGSQVCHLVWAGTLHDGQGSLTTAGKSSWIDSSGSKARWIRPRRRQDIRTASLTVKNLNGDVALNGMVPSYP